jgi:hypothetical protein
VTLLRVERSLWRDTPRLWEEARYQATSTALGKRASLPVGFSSATGLVFISGSAIDLRETTMDENAIVAAILATALIGRTEHADPADTPAAAAAAVRIYGDVLKAVRASSGRATTGLGGYIERQVEKAEKAKHKKT